MKSLLYSHAQRQFNTTVSTRINILNDFSVTFIAEQNLNFTNTSADVFVRLKRTGSGLDDPPPFTPVERCDIYSVRVPRFVWPSNW